MRSWLYLHRFPKKFVNINSIFKAIKVNDKMWVQIFFRQVAIHSIFMRQVLKINLTLVLRVLILKRINLLIRIFKISIYTKYSFSSGLKVWITAPPKRVIEKQNPSMKYVLSTIRIEWAYLRQNRRDKPQQVWDVFIWNDLKWIKQCQV